MEFFFSAPSDFGPPNIDCWLKHSNDHEFVGDSTAIHINTGPQGFSVIDGKTQIEVSIHTQIDQSMN